jgi:hypothetical protein
MIETNPEQLICNPLQLKTWKQTGIVLALVFALTLGLSFMIENVQSRTKASVKTTFSYQGEEYESMKVYYMRRYKVMFPIISTNFSDMNDLILPSTPQYKALQWIVAKDTVIQLQESSERFLESEITDFSLSPVERWTIDDTNYQRLQQRYAVLVLYYSLCGEAWKTTSIENATTLVELHELPIGKRYNISECNFLGFQCGNDSTPSFDPTAMDSSHVLTSINLEAHNLAGTSNAFSSAICSRFLEPPT